MGRLFNAVATGVIVVGLAAVIRARRSLWVDAANELDTYPDITTDTYLVALLDADGGVLELRSAYPFFGTEWGQYCPAGEDEDE